MATNKYWANRNRERLYNASLGTAEAQLADAYISCFEATRDDLTALYDAIVAEQVGSRDYVLPSDLYRYNRYYEMLNNLQAKLVSLGRIENVIGEEKLTELYLNSRRMVQDELHLQSVVNPETVKQAINATWCPDGKNWSGRIWHNKSLLQEKIKNGVIECIARGVSKDELVKDLRKTFNTGFSNADRIARTELSYVQNQAVFDEYKSAGVERYQILSAHDERTCDETCIGEDGKIYYLNQASVGTTYPPFHPNCRCGVLAVLDLDLGG